MEIVIAIVILVVLAAVALLAASRRQDSSSAISEVSAETRKRDRERVKASVGAAAVEGGVIGRDVEKTVALERRKAELAVPEAEVEPWVAPDPETIGVARRQFLNRAIIAVFGLNLTGFGLAVIAQLWPGASEGFGSAIRVGTLNDVVASIRASNGFLYLPEGRMYVTEYPIGSLENAAPIYASTPAWPGIEAGVKAVFQKCPHLGCRVPECGSSQFFECPCHGSTYNRVGEKRGGPAPRGMDFFAMDVTAGVLTVDTGNIIGGPAIGVNTTGQEREGPSCLGASSHA